MDYSRFLVYELNHLSEEFRENELAYLVFTAKSEYVIKDRLAFRLYRKLYQQNLIVAREWKSIDLVILQDKKPLVFIETTVTHTSSLTNVNDYPGKMVKDICKRQSKAEADTEIYSLLWATHFKNRINKKWDGVNKYRPGINGGFKKYKDEDGVLSKASKNIMQCFRGFEKHLQFGRIEAGSAFGNELDVCYWLFGPFSPSDTLPKVPK